MSIKYNDSGQWRSTGKKRHLWLIGLTLTLMFVDAHGLFLCVRERRLPATGKLAFRLPNEPYISDCQPQTQRHLKWLRKDGEINSVPRIPDVSEKVLGLIPRLDPLNKFRRYNKGFNVTNLHYWSSAAFTGIWGYAVAFICLVIGIVVGTRHCWTWGNLPLKDKLLPFNMHPGLPILCVFQFSVLSLAAAGVIFWGNKTLGYQLKACAKTLIGTVDHIKTEVDDAISLIPIANIGAIANQEVAKKFLSACHNLAETFKELTVLVEENKELVYRVFYSAKVAVTIIAVFTVILVIVGMLCMIKGWHIPLMMVFSIAVLVLVASWMVAGVSFVLTSVVTDGCQAMKAYDGNPHNSSIARLLPCLTPVAAAKTLGGAKSAIKIVIKRTNKAVDLLNAQEERMADRGEIAHPTILPHLCDPFGPEPEYLPAACSPGQGSFSRFQEDYGMFQCNVDNITFCLGTTTPIPNFVFQEATLAMNATKNVYLILPTIFRIISCNVVKMTFEDILAHRCRPLKSALTVMWVAFIVSSLAMMPLLVLWTRVCKSTSSNRVEYLLRREPLQTEIQPTSLN